MKREGGWIWKDVSHLICKSSNFSLSAQTVYYPAVGQALRNTLIYGFGLPWHRGSVKTLMREREAAQKLICADCDNWCLLDTAVNVWRFRTGHMANKPQHVIKINTVPSSCGSKTSGWSFKRTSADGDTVRGLFLVCVVSLKPLALRLLYIWMLAHVHMVVHVCEGLRPVCTSLLHSIHSSCWKNPLTTLPANKDYILSLTGLFACMLPRVWNYRLLLKISLKCV